MRIQHNIMAMNAYRNYNTNTSALAKNLEKLSSGYKINRAGDDAAGLAISEKMRAQITGLEAAQKNVKDGVSLVKTAEGAMQEIQDMLNRMDYLATQSANGTYDNETDRANLQKEVDALKSEINRIADSANFNGIKLLDGKAGINTTAFSFDSVSGTSAQPGGSATVSFVTAAGTNFHTTKDDVAAQAPEFSINLDTLVIDATGISSNATAAVTLSFGGVSVEIAVTGGATYGATAIASAIETAFNTLTVDGGTSAGGLIGSDYVFKATADGNNIKFTLVGKKNGTNYDSFTADDIVKGTDDTALNALAGVKGGEVKIDIANTLVKSGEFNHNVDDVKQAIAETAGERAGITFSIDNGILTDGSTITIDGKKFTIMLNPDDTSTPAADSDTAGTIDLRKFASASANDQMTELVNQLSQKGTKNFDIEKTTDGKIHIDQKDTSTEKYTDEAALKAVVSTEIKGQDAVNAGTKITVSDATKIADGNRITVGDKTFMFTSDPSKLGTNDAGVKDTQVSTKTAQGLGDALTAAGFDVTVSGNDVIVRSATSGAAAPTIAGTGLTLQIGDTSDSFNRLDVKIGDMHVSAMKDATTGASIFDVDISNPEGASAAINTIKAAINYVSGVRGDLGAVQNRLEHTANNLSVMAENIQDAESTIRDTDVAEEMMAYTKNNILVQSAQAMLAQANAVPQGVLQLLG